MKNLAGKECNIDVRAELEEAGIKVTNETRVQRFREPITDLMGIHKGWIFHRAWRYWTAQGSPIPLGDAQKLRHHDVISWGGMSGGCDPNEHNTDNVHIDSQEGLTAFRSFLDSLVHNTQEKREE